MFDVRCFDDLDDAGEEITDPLEALEQDNYHRLITPPGGNIDDPAFGLGLPLMLSGNDRALDSLSAQIEGELLEDERNAEVRALITAGTEPGAYDIAIAIVTDDGAILNMRLRASGDVVELL